VVGDDSALLVHSAARGCRRWCCPSPAYSEDAEDVQRARVDRWCNGRKRVSTARERGKGRTLDCRARATTTDDGRRTAEIAHNADRVRNDLGGHVQVGRRRRSGEMFNLSGGGCVGAAWQAGVGFAVGFQGCMPRCINWEQVWQASGKPWL
jgi:hypothetical protein